MKDKLKIYIGEELERAEKMVKKCDCYHEDEPLLMREMIGYCKGIKWTLRHLPFFREQIDLERRMNDDK